MTPLNPEQRKVFDQVVATSEDADVDLTLRICFGEELGFRRGVSELADAVRRAICHLHEANPTGLQEAIDGLTDPVFANRMRMILEAHPVPEEAVHT
ncbi:MAG: hypothetical protein PHX87_05375 [Candidatus Peribacteraceae bacterium]|nr:hypothetical protein [Candidatus Peribacteraceae bacterium]MDD5742825.1 hypothetical protein [Candidatus Peribacteraceae bacterium]